MDKLIYVIPVFVAGMGLSLQGIVNGGLARGLNSALIAATVSFWVGGFMLTTASLASGGVGQAIASARSLGPGWWIGGGVLGAAFVTAVTFAAPRVGIAATMAFAISGQLVAAAALDHFGVLGTPVHPFNLIRAAGIGMLICGALLVRFF